MREGGCKRMEDGMNGNVVREIKCVCVWINVAPGDSGLWVAMTFALPGVEEREAYSDRVCEQLSHLLQATGYVAGLSKLTVRSALPPSLSPTLSPALPPSLSVFTASLPFSSSLPFSLLFAWPAYCLSHILCHPLYFMQSACSPLSPSSSLCTCLFLSSAYILEGAR